MKAFTERISRKKFFRIRDGYIKKFGENDEVQIQGFYIHYLQTGKFPEWA